MTISYNWLLDYLPEPIEPEKLSAILTSIGLEVEELRKFETIPGGLQGLVVGEVMECMPHPNADKLKITKVDIGAENLLQIVCGAANVAVGQKVVVAPVGSTIYPIKGEPIQLRKAVIRKVESEGMICAEDEIGWGASHDGILVLPNNLQAGMAVAEFANLYSDWVYEIGLTPNRMDAMSHAGVARDVCAYLTHHQRDSKPVMPSIATFKPDLPDAAVSVSIENTEACKRYAGVSLVGVEVKESPDWLKNRLLSIGLRPINNIVDITNFILHDTGQPLHAFDADAITGNQVIVKKLADGTRFVTLDDKERTLGSEDLMICNAVAPMCMGGVFGGKQSGVSASTTRIFLESAWFESTGIRKSSLRHELRTDAATRFEKGVDISQTVSVLKRAALLIKELAGGLIAGDIIDVYPSPAEKKEVSLKYHYLKKLSGKNYHVETVKKILTALGFEVVREGIDEIRFAVPLHKTDISLPADLVEEIVRIDGLDNIEIPSSITISPSLDALSGKENMKNKLAGFLTGRGFMEIFTNSITSSKYYSEVEQASGVRMINSLSAELDMMRPSMLETGLEAISYNLNRKNSRLFFFEFGKTYHIQHNNVYKEKEHLTLYLTGEMGAVHWRDKPAPADYFAAKGLGAALVQLLGLSAITFEAKESGVTQINYANKCLGNLVEVSAGKLSQFGIRQSVFMIDFEWQSLMDAAAMCNTRYKEVNKFPVVQRDLSAVVDASLPFGSVEAALQKLALPRLTHTRLFDVFESEKLGNHKKSFAISFFFSDEEKTLTDKEVDDMMAAIISQLEKVVHAEIRK
ncbi:MAG: phenylalanine--tRNA ligase subunit beta [Sediminibacterium sp.]|nr:phenylalanine--tRNA ligase subunit beta [Sediminibacterium sp.]